MKSIFEHQKYLMEEVYKLSNNPEAMVEHYRVASLALIDEVMEALHHTPWKPWSKRATWDWNELHEELVDVFTFVVELCQLSGLSPEKLQEGYFAKAKINQDRQDSGTYGIDPQYPGLSKQQLDKLNSIAELGECTTAQVGCLIVTRDGHEAWGYNCSADGTPCAHAASEGCNGKTVHAEVAALADAAQRGFCVSGAKAYVTHDPCNRCLTTFTLAGINEVRTV